MNETRPLRQGRPPVDWSDLAPRIVSAIVLVVLALIAAALGGWLFVVTWIAASALVMMEWLRLVSSEKLLLRTGAQVTGLILMGGLAELGHWELVAPLVALMTTVAIALALPVRRIWDGAGVIYASSLLLAVIAARQSAEFGLVAIVWLFTVVWATDICAYFSGKSIGGPKLWPRVSPKKTWAGIIGGAAGGVLAGLLTLFVAQIPLNSSAALAALFIAVASQGGDLFESFLKRHFGVKDTGNIIPGHGGLMDRLDGFIVAASCAALMGWLRVPGDIARGILVW